ncbi:MAG: glycosyltransferase family 39 protein [Cyanobacteria bacterium P01_H01_bin.15]
MIRKKLLKSPQIWFLLLAIALGILLRTQNIAGKLYWIDETFTLLRVSGYTTQDVTETVYGQDVVTVEELQKYQGTSPKDPGIQGTLLGLALEEPQHPPLYFALSRFWAEIFGSSKTALRSLGVLGSLLGFPALYWLCRELFPAQPLISLWTMALYAVSPVAIRYAQAARQYSLWFSLTVLSNALLLRALRKDSVWSWVGYGFAIASSLYCHFLAGLMLIAQGLFVVLLEHFRPTRRFFYFIGAAVGAVLLFLPWVMVALLNPEKVAETTSHLEDSLSWLNMVQLWIVGLTKTLFAAHFRFTFQLVLIGIPLSLCVFYSLYHLWRYGPRPTKLLLFCWLGTFFLPFLALDLIVGGQRTVQDRYFLPCYAVIYIVLAYGIVTAQQSPRSLQHKLGQSIGAIALTLGIVSSVIAIPAPTWWGLSEFDVEIAQIINAAPNPVLVTDGYFFWILRLAQDLNPQTQLAFRPESTPLETTPAQQQIFYYNPSPKLQQTLVSQGQQPEPVYEFRDDSTGFTVTLYRVSS